MTSTSPAPGHDQGTTSRNLPDEYKKVKSLRPYARAILELGHLYGFAREASVHQKQVVNEIVEEEGWLDVALKVRGPSADILHDGTRDSSAGALDVSCANSRYLAGFRGHLSGLLGSQRGHDRHRRPRRYLSQRLLRPSGVLGRWTYRIKMCFRLHHLRSSQ
jgi:hypothetical protein